MDTRPSAPGIPALGFKRKSSQVGFRVMEPGLGFSPQGGMWRFTPKLQHRGHLHRV